MISETDPTEAERQVLRAADTGDWVDLRSGDQQVDDLAQGATWGVNRTVRAELLVELLTGVRNPKTGPPRRVGLQGARITGPLDLGYSTIVRPLWLRDCYLDDHIDLRHAEALTVNMTHCHVPELEASGLRIGGMNLTNLVCFGLWLRAARISGQLDLTGATIDNPQGTALNAEELVVERSMLCRNGFSANGHVSLNAARIGGQLDLSKATLTNPHGPALTARYLIAERGMYCEGITATGEVALSNAHIGGNLDLYGARLSNPDGLALTADHITVEHTMIARGIVTEGEVTLQEGHVGRRLELSGARLTNPQGRALDASAVAVGSHVICRDGFTAQGEVQLQFAKIGGQFRISAASISNENATALGADGMVVNGSMSCNDGFSVEGELRLRHARIGGDLELRQTKLTNPNGSALNAHALSVGDDMWCCDGFSAEGEVQLSYASIGGSAHFIGAHLTNPRRLALSATKATVAQILSFSNGFSVEGEVRLNGARIGDVVIVRATLSNPAGQALNAERLLAETMFVQDESTVTGGVRLTGSRIVKSMVLKEAEFTTQDDLTLDLQGIEVDRLVLLPEMGRDGAVNLVDARVRRLIDDPHTWSAKISLDGFVYERLGDEADDVTARLRWLNRNRSGYSPQVFEQLAAVYRQAGNENAARRVLVEKQSRRRRQLNPLGKAWNWLLFVTVGYGYRPWLAALWLAALVAAGSWVFGQAFPQHVVPTTDTAPAFHPVIYTLDVLLPIVDLGQQKAWLPRGAAAYWSWALIGAGWALATTVVAGLTRVLIRE